MKIAELKPGMRRVDVKGKIVDVESPREVQTKFGPGQVASATLQDESGSVKVTLWNENISKVAVNDTIEIHDRKSTRLNSSHSQISYAVFCLKKKKKYKHRHRLRRTNRQLLCRVLFQEGGAYSRDRSVVMMAICSSHQRIQLV